MPNIRFPSKQKNQKETNALTNIIGKALRHTQNHTISKSLLEFYSTKARPNTFLYLYAHITYLSTT